MSIPVLSELARALVRLSSIGLDKGPNITRYSMYEQLSGVFPPGTTGRVLSVSHSLNLLHVLFDATNCDIVEANYPEFNILALPFADETFDYVVSDQVLEHVEGNLEQAVAETHRVLRPGGWAIHTTCLLLPIHAQPDFWRVTPSGLRFLARHFRKVQVGSWGNPFFFLVQWSGLRIEPVPRARWHPLAWVARFNKPSWPVSTWVAAQK